MNATRIDKRIVKYRVQKPEDKTKDTGPIIVGSKVSDGAELTKGRDGRMAKVIRLTERCSGRRC